MQENQIVTSMNFSLPKWIQEELACWPTHLPSTNEQMRLAIALSRKNVEHKTGGPFGAIVIDESTGLVLSVGVNRVEHTNCSLLHAEAVALMLAQQRINGFDLGGPGMPRRKLVTSAQPCVQCFGNIHWSGIWAMAIGATKGDVETLTGFDEGPLHPNWREELRAQGLSLEEEVMRREASAVLRYYRESGGFIYQGRRSKPLG